MTSASPKAVRFPLIPFDEVFVDRSPSYLVKGIVPRVGVTLIYGPPKCGKTFWILDLLLHVALGRSYRGRRVIQGPVVYCVLEAPNGFRKRIEAFRQHKMERSAKGTPFYTIAAKMSLVADHQRLIADIRAALGDTPPATIAIDTLKRSIVGSDSDDNAIGVYMEAADALAAEFQCAVIVVHHSGLEAGRPRGSTALSGAVDAQLVCAKSAGNKIAVTVQHMRDGADGESLISVRRQVEIGIDEDGDPITSMVVDHVDGEQAPVSVAAPVLSEPVKKTLDALHEAVKAADPLPASIVDWNTRAIALGITSSTKESAPRMAFNRAAERLTALGIVGTDGKHAWLLQPPAHSHTL